MRPSPPPRTAPIDGSASSRRGFLAVLSFALAGALAALAGVPVLGALFSPLVRPREAGDRPFVPALKLSDLVPGIPRRVEIKADLLDAWSRQDGVVLGATWLLKEPSGEVVAFSTVCPHLGCSVDFDSKRMFACPCHASAFALDGRVIGGPSPRPMDRLETQVKDGWVLVRYVRFRQGLPSPEEV